MRARPRADALLTACQMLNTAAACMQCMRKRLCLEVRAPRRGHAGVCTDPPLIIMEYCQRGSLYDVLKQASEVPVGTQPSDPVPYHLRPCPYRSKSWDTTPHRRLGMPALWLSMLQG